jgi:hypothetical protein
LPRLEQRDRSFENVLPEVVEGAVRPEGRLVTVDLEEVEDPRLSRSR